MSWEKEENSLTCMELHISCVIKICKAEHTQSLFLQHVSQQGIFGSSQKFAPMPSQAFPDITCPPSFIIPVPSFGEFHSWIKEHHNHGETYIHKMTPALLIFSRLLCHGPSLHWPCRSRLLPAHPLPLPYKLPHSFRPVSTSAPPWAPGLQSEASHCSFGQHLAGSLPHQGIWVGFLLSRSWTLSLRPRLGFLPRGFPFFVVAWIFWTTKPFWRPLGEWASSNSSIKFVLVFILRAFGCHCEI